MPGILVTSAHLVGDAGEVTVTRPDGERHTARYSAGTSGPTSPPLRIADDSALPPLHSGSGLSQARTGDAVFAISPDGVVATGAIR